MAANLLLGLCAVNVSKEPGDHISHDDRMDNIRLGSKLLTSVFKAVPYTSIGAAAANALAEILQRQGQADRVRSHRVHVLSTKR